jgi:hypothetical protein
MAQNIIEDSYSSFQEDNAQSTNQVRDKWAGYPLLVIDEFDAMSGREWSINFMRSVLDARYRYREERATIIISNSYPLTRMKQWDAQKQRDVCALLGVKALAELPALPSHLGWLESRLDGGNFAFMVGNDLRAKAK